jgi:XRE family aerobic/anaerobic benzoate catabolism transcriptional regulator
MHYIAYKFDFQMISVTKSSESKTVSGRDSGDGRLLASLGERVRALRERRGITRKSLSAATGVSERYLANIEYGEGNVSLLVLDQVAAALDCSLAELIGDFRARSPEWLMIRALLTNRDESELRRIRIAIGEMFDGDQAALPDSRRIALIGLRGAGKSTLGKMLADRLDVPFLELSREIELLAACTIGEIQALYGPDAFRRYQKRALIESIAAHDDAVIAIPGGLVSDADAYDLLLANCRCLWLQATPEDHMQRVIEQGDFRPLQGRSEAMHDLQQILASRQPHYARAQLRLDTSKQSLPRTFERLHGLIRKTSTASEQNQPSKPTLSQEMTS